ncbi:hypothetical protein GUH49_22955 [Xanthomonas citri pv. citri]|nr:hypothetical protein [Xanthomonas citri]MBD1478228.1 hypothetical protein [Xanthomonas citri pv. citri]
MRALSTFVGLIGRIADCAAIGQSSRQPANKSTASLRTVASSTAAAALACRLSSVAMFDTFQQPQDCIRLTIVIRYFMNRFKRDTGDVKREKPKPKRRKLNLTVALLPSLFFNDEEAMLTLTKKEGNPPAH